MPHTPDHHYLTLLAQQYPSIQATATKIIELSAMLELPKGTEHFLSDIHGEYEAFQHVLRNGSGTIKRRIDELFQDTLTQTERQELATLIYYPEEKLSLLLENGGVGGNSAEIEKQRIYLAHLLRLCHKMTAKYTRKQVRDAFPTAFNLLIDELLHHDKTNRPRQAYYRGIIDQIIATGSGRAFIIALAQLVQRLAIAKLHIIGDVYDRGAGAHLIMDRLLDYHNVDIQWGNHDIVWMGAAAGSGACIASVIRVSLRYANMETLENGYAISMLPLASFAMQTYGDDPCAYFQPKVSPGDEFTDNEIALMAKMQKAIAIIQFKLEGQIIKRRPHYGMSDRLLLHCIDHETGTIVINGKRFELRDTHLPTIDPDDPYGLNSAEQTVIDRLRHSFANSEKLQRHTRFLFSKGSMYAITNGNLLYHGCIPMREDGSFMTMRIGGQKLAARSHMDHLDKVARQGYFSNDPETKSYGMDAMWYMWTGGASPLYGKDKMATFERYFIADKTTHKETKNAYFRLRDLPETASRILKAFDLPPERATIVNGHVPVAAKAGESPVKANGRLIVIDGGFAKAYQKQTGIAGYTLIYNSWGMLLAAHEPFESRRSAIEDAVDMETETQILQQNYNRIRVKDTDEGAAIRRQINNLQALLAAYRSGEIPEAA